jgi:hypothetical protein
MVMACHQNSGQNRNIQIANKPSENVAKFKYFGTTETDQNFTHEEIKSSLNSGNACYHSFQKLFYSHLLPKKPKG